MTRIWKKWTRPHGSGRALELEYVSGGWAQGEERRSVRGWNAPSVVENQASWWEGWQRPLRSPSPLGSGLSSSESDVGLHNTLVSFAYVAALAAQNKRRWSLLDWGGGAGQYGFLAESVVPDSTVEYSCKDVPVQCAAGLQMFPHGTFFSTDEEFQGLHFDLVLASGSLHYVENWTEVLERLSAATGNYLFVTRLPVVVRAPSYVVLQRAYQSEYLGWTLNRGEFLEAAEQLGLKLVREFLLAESHCARGAPEKSQSRGFLFRHGGLHGS